MASAAAFEAEWGRIALLHLPAAELVDRALLQFGAQATSRAQLGRATPQQALIMLRAFHSMELDLLGGRAGTLVLGRAEDAELRIDDGSVSKRHAVIRFTNAHSTIEDFGSLNGTSVNGRVLTGPTPLRDGDLIRMGDAYRVFVTTSTLFLQLESVRHSTLGAH